MTAASRARVLLAALLLASLAHATPASPGPAEVGAKVVWAREDRVYVAAPDSSALEPSARLTFIQRNRPVATGEIERVVGELAVARLTSGSLARVKKLDRLRVLVERPPLRALPVMRIGYPSSERRNLIFSCGSMAVRRPSPVWAYRAETLGEGSYRVVRDGPGVGRPLQPETLLVRLFDEATDEEIALERGELDVAIFWPGEPSTHLREEPRWRDFEYGISSRGALAAVEIGPAAPGDPGDVAAPDSFALATLNRELFRDDLAPWARLPAGSSAAAGAGAAGWAAPTGASSRPRPPLGSVRVAVDPSCPARQLMERFLNPGGSSGAEGARQVRVFYLDAVLGAPDSLGLGVADYLRSVAVPAELGARADSLAALIRRREPPAAPDSLGRWLRDVARVRLLFALRCPVVCATRLRPYVGALGLDALVDLVACRPAGRQP